jgi:hypothetical protein
MISLYFLFIISFFADQNLVEKFELIATTGKNAKMPIIQLYNQLNFQTFVYC